MDPEFICPCARYARVIDINNKPSSEQDVSMEFNIDNIFMKGVIMRTCFILCQARGINCWPKFSRPCDSSYEDRKANFIIDTKANKEVNFEKGFGII